jgi:hypothetical protein
MHVASIGMSLLKNGQAQAIVIVHDSNGNPVPGATVTGSWSGLATGTASVVTSSSGTADFRSARVRGSGTVTFTVTGVTLSGYVYQAGSITSGSITR